MESTAIDKIDIAKLDNTPDKLWVDKWARETLVIKFDTKYFEEELRTEIERQINMLK